jgi:hypothetical protein
MDPTRHPDWCSAEHCTATAEPALGRSEGPSGRHCSAPVTLPKATWHGDAVLTTARGPVMRLTQQLAPWDTNVMLRLGLA